MTTTIRELQGDEIYDVMHQLPFYAFRSSPPLGDKIERQESLQRREGAHFVAIFEDSRAVTCAESAPLIQNMRGALFPMGGILDVTTDPAARRKGYAKRSLAHLYRLLHEDGRVTSCLYPFRESFYERLGYVTLPQPRKAIFAPSALLPILDRDPGGSVERVLLGDAYDVYRDFIFKVRPHIHGMAEFEYDDWFGAHKNDYWLALAKVGSELVGLMLYDMKGERITEFTMGVRRFFYLTSQGKYLLLAWIAHHTDQANRVELFLPPFEHPETWASDLQVHLEAAFITPMGRVLDVSKIGGMATGPGRFTARIEDAICPWNEGVWQFESVDGKLVVRSAGVPDCDLGIQAISALAYGTQDPADFVIRGWGNPAPAVQDTMRSLFPPLLPFVHETF
jgi:predicted acetyltransferase